MSFHYSAVIIAPVALREAFNALSVPLGWGEGNLSVPLHTGAEITHYAGRTWATESFGQMVANALNGILPPELEGADPAQVQALLAALIIDITPRTEGEGEDAITINYDSPAAHFQSVVDANGLEWIRETEA